MAGTRSVRLRGSVVTTERYAQEDDSGGLRWFVWFCWHDGSAQLVSGHDGLDEALEDAAPHVGLVEAEGGSVSICEGSALVMTNGGRS